MNWEKIFLCVIASPFIILFYMIKYGLILMYYVGLFIIGVFIGLIRHV